MKTEPLPLNFRASEVKRILAALVAGDSCSVVGIGSVGKSNLLRFLQQEDVHQTYFDDALSNCLFVYVDINKILKRSVWGLLELILHQLLIELTNRDVPKTTLQTIDDLHQRATAPRTRYLALRYLDRAIRVVCNQLGLRLVLLIDEFDELCRTMPSRGFAILRALRDDYKYRLMYVVATRLALNRLREEVSEMEAFEELVSPHTIWLGPYSADDATVMVRRLEARHDVPLGEDTTKAVLSATGGHPGLLREGYHVARRHPSDFFEMLTHSGHVQDECQRLWLSLAPEEQKAMAHLANDNLVPPEQIEIVEQMRYKGLVGGPWVAGQEIFSSLFADYIRQQHPKIGARIHVDHKHRAVWVSGHKVRDLTRLEYKLMAYLVDKRGQVCSRDELIQHLYPEDMTLEEGGVADNRLDSVVKRLRKRIEPRPKEPRYIITIRGHGFQLVNNG